MDLTVQIELLEKELSLLKEKIVVLMEYRHFVTDISFEYNCRDPAGQAEMGLTAIRILSKGKLSEERFKSIWLLWKERMEEEHGKEK